MDARIKTSISLSDVIFVFGLSLMAIAIPVIVVWLHCFRGCVVALSQLHLTLGILLILPALFLFGFNLYTSFLRPWIFRRSHGSFDGYKYMSGAPVLGSILIGIAAFFLPSSVWIGVALFTIYFLDPGGIHVAAIILLRECFTDASKSA